MNILPHIKPTETIYHGYRFRSRTEARWAVAFSVAGVEFEYEPERYRLSGELGTYLPDFFTHALPDRNIRPLWIEVKGREPESEAFKKLAALCDLFACEGLMLIGQPDTHGKLYHYRRAGSFETKTQSHLLALLGIDEQAFLAARRARFELLDNWPLPPPTIVSRPYEQLIEASDVTKMRAHLIALYDAYREIRLLWWAVAILTLIAFVLFFMAVIK